MSLTKPRGFTRRQGWSVVAMLAAALLAWLVFAVWPAWLSDILISQKAFVSPLFNRLTLAGLYFLVANGFTLIFGPMRNVNLAHGPLYPLGACLGHEVALVGWVAVRTTGIDTIIITLATATANGYFTQQNAALFDGHSGFSGLHAPVAQGIDWRAAMPFYDLCLGAAALSYGAVLWASRSTFGLTLQAIRDNPRRMRAVGHDATAHKVFASALAGAPRLIRFDEPAAGLSPAKRGDLVAILAGLPAHIGDIVLEHVLDVALGTVTYGSLVGCSSKARPPRSRPIQSHKTCTGGAPWLTRRPSGSRIFSCTRVNPKRCRGSNDAGDGHPVGRAPQRDGQIHVVPDHRRPETRAVGLDPGGGARSVSAGAARDPSPWRGLCAAGAAGARAGWWTVDRGEGAADAPVTQLPNRWNVPVTALRQVAPAEPTPQVFAIPFTERIGKTVLLAGPFDTKGPRAAFPGRSAEIAGIAAAHGRSVHLWQSGASGCDGACRQLSSGGWGYGDDRRSERVGDGRGVCRLDRA